ncbi:penicillin-binding transpeptidase domain-containing protein [Escherichia coli]
MALVGGFDFNQSKFNRATQAPRQVGSNIKPFLYTAAMDKGLTLASMLNDVPFSRWDAGAGSDWQPKNSPPQYAGPIRLRQGLGQSKNVVMVPRNAGDGRRLRCRISATLRLPAQNIVHTESLALGSASFTPMQVARGYAVMANGGFLWTRGLSAKLKTIRGGVIFEAKPKVACPECDIPVIYGDTQKSNVLENNDVEMSLSPASSRMFCTNAAAGAGKSGVSGEDWRAGVRTARHQHSAGIPD